MRQIYSGGRIQSAREAIEWAIGDIKKRMVVLKSFNYADELLRLESTRDDIQADLDWANEEIAKLEKAMLMMGED